MTQRRPLQNNPKKERMNMTRQEAETKLKAAGLTADDIRLTLNTISDHARARQNAMRQGPGEFGNRDLRSDREFNRLFAAGVKQALTQPR
jgi:hypothetical protein